MIVSGLGWWKTGIVTLKLGLRPSFILKNKSRIVAGLGWWGLGLGVLRPVLQLHSYDKLCLFLDLDDEALDLSVMTTYDCFRTWMMGRWTWSFEVAPSASLVMTNYDRFRTLMMERWTCYSEAGPSAQLHSNDKSWLFPDLDDGALDLEFAGQSFSFIRNDKSWLFADLDDGALDLSFWSWAFGPASFLMTNYACFRTRIRS